MSTRLRTSCLLSCVLIGMTATADAFADGKDDRPYMFSATAVIEHVECYQCVKWPGSNFTARVADKIIATVVGPSEFSGRHINLYVWNDNDKSQIWLPDSHVSFPAFVDMMERDRAVFPLSETKVVTK